MEKMIEYKGREYSPAMLADLREWVADCQWEDGDEEFSDIAILRGVDRHYCGGLASFDFSGH